ncbi:MAG: carbamoyltransferase HypF [Elusimicrobia bacterium]|nr:carbamoyltransferase HypF [Elusimicrobiota bacterium]
MNIRKKMIINGVVQGIGFRPFVYKIALKNKISGFVKNTSLGVIIEAQGSKSDIRNFVLDLKLLKPGQSEIESLKISPLKIKNEKEFKIIKSEKTLKTQSIIPPDLALCPDCRKEMRNPKDRRYLYPFINCTNCGPRFTIVKSIPYDRPLTTMKKFKMCPSCKREYENPFDRRFHAQPNACPDCGPRVFSIAGRKILKGFDALVAAADIIVSGGICSLQSLGGFHIACDALNEKAVSKIRKYKVRPSKPFALMVSNLKEAKKICFIGEKEKKILLSPSSPVVMLRKRDFACDLIAPGLSTLGLMFSYTPLHEALFQILRAKGFYNPLIMTSGNKRDEPIAKTVLQAREKLKGLIDLALYNNRDIHNRIDDSVGFVMKDAFYLIRRARGYVPNSIKMPVGSKKSVLAFGADLKNTFCLTRDSHAFVSQHIGDLSETQNQDFQSETVSKFKKLLSVKPDIIASDMHPNYHSTLAAKKTKARQVKVQHHLAHILSVAAEHQIKKPFMGLALDGTGYGLDSNIWGSEFLSVRDLKAERLAHLAYFGLPGGEAAQSEIWRCSLSLIKMLDKKFLLKGKQLLKGIKQEKIRIVEKMIESKINLPLTSSMGRLFDAVASLAQIRHFAEYEAQGPMELESLFKNKSSNPYKFLLCKNQNKIIIDPLPVIAEILKEPFTDSRAQIISEKFHTAVALMIKDVFVSLRKINKIRMVCLSGGVFQNKVILYLTKAFLEKEKFRVFTNRLLPSNDACVSLGQAYGALKKIEFKL